MGRLNCDGYGYTRGYGSGRVEILSTGRVRVRITVLCYGYGSGYSLVVVSFLPLGRFLASMFSILSSFPPLSLIPRILYDASFRNSFSMPNRLLPLGLFSVISLSRVSHLSRPM